MKCSLIKAVALSLMLGIVPLTAQEKMPPADYVPYEKAPEALKQVQAAYPEAAAKDGLEGTVWVKAWIDETGTVAKAIIQRSDNKIFENAAITAVKQWTFKPAIARGEPVDVWVTIPFRFKLESGGKSQMQSTHSMPKEHSYPPAEDVKHDTEPVLVSQVNPKYPPEALPSGLGGIVYTKMWIDEQGQVVEVIVTKSDSEIFNKPSIDAGLKWVFKPAMANGKPIAVWVTVPFRFALMQK
jgi:TonB family protein